MCSTKMVKYLSLFFLVELIALPLSPRRFKKKIKLYGLSIFFIEFSLLFFFIIIRIQNDVQQILFI